MKEEIKMVESVEIKEQQPVDEKSEIAEQLKAEVQESNAQSTVEYSKDANGVLYKAEPNDNTENSDKQ